MVGLRGQIVTVNTLKKLQHQRLDQENLNERSFSNMRSRYRANSELRGSQVLTFSANEGPKLQDLPTSLLVRNLRHDCRPEDLRGPFSQFGRLKDIYLPRDYHTGEPRGFGFVQFVDPADAADAKYHMDGCVLLGRELTVVFAEENRKKPAEMRAREPSRGRSYDRRRSPLHYSRSPRYARRYSRSPDYYSPSPKRRGYSRSISPRDRRYREGSYPRSPYVSRSQSRSRSRSRSIDHSR
ncbi:hypothetical protein QYF36_001498 [Acer negundo]|nr:hypothetical protein QYF36_001498 [Acer negundo]